MGLSIDRRLARLEEMVTETAKGERPRDVFAMIEHYRDGFARYYAGEVPFERLPRDIQAAVQSTAPYAAAFSRIGLRAAITEDPA